MRSNSAEIQNQFSRKLTGRGDEKNHLLFVKSVLIYAAALNFLNKVMLFFPLYLHIILRRILRRIQPGLAPRNRRSSTDQFWLITFFTTFSKMQMQRIDKWES